MENKSTIIRKIICQNQWIIDELLKLPANSEDALFNYFVSYLQEAVYQNPILQTIIDSNPIRPEYIDRMKNSPIKIQRLAQIIEINLIWLRPYLQSIEKTNVQPIEVASLREFYIQPNESYPMNMSRTVLDNSRELSSNYNLFTSDMRKRKDKNSTFQIIGSHRKRVDRAMPGANVVDELVKTLDAVRDLTLKNKHDRQNISRTLNTSRNSELESGYGRNVK